MFLRNWREDGGVYENYNAETGRGGDVWNAARLYHWGGLLAFIAIQELIDVEPAGFVRFGSIQLPDAAIRNVQVGEHRYDIELHDGVTVLRDGRPFLECSCRTIIRIPLTTLPAEPIEISAGGAGRLTLHAPSGPSRRLCVNGGPTARPTSTAAGTVYDW